MRTQRSMQELQKVAHHTKHLKHLRIRIMQTHAYFDAAKNERNNAHATHDIKQVNKGELEASSTTCVKSSSTLSSRATRRLPEGSTCLPNIDSIGYDSQDGNESNAKQAARSAEAAYHTWLGTTHLRRWRVRANSVRLQAHKTKCI